MVDLFETLLDGQDAIISDALNHASIIDGVRLSKAKRFRYTNNDMAHLEARLQEATDSRFRLIATDCVFSMDGTIANLKGICDLAEKYDAMLWSTTAMLSALSARTEAVRPSIAASRAGWISLLGRSARRWAGLPAAITSGKRQVIDWLRQRSWPYLFSNTLMPAIAAASIRAFTLMERGVRCAKDFMPLPTASGLKCRIRASRWLARTIQSFP